MKRCQGNKGPANGEKPRLLRQIYRAGSNVVTLQRPKGAGAARLNGSVE
jgi:hypothetical protein